MELGLMGQVAVVVGAASGIGRAIATAFAAEGAMVVLTDRAETVKVTALELTEQYSVQTLGVVADVTDYAAMQRAVAEIDDTFGGADHLVYAAGMGSGKGGLPFWNPAIGRGCWRSIYRAQSILLMPLCLALWNDDMAHGCLSLRWQGRSVRRPIRPTVQPRQG